MKLWFIKLGKAMTALQKEGLFRGGRRIFASFLALFRRVGKGDVLIITGGLGDSARYRAWHVAEELIFQGIPTRVAVQDNPFLACHVSKFQVFIFHRTMVTPAIRAMIEKIKAQKKTIIFDTDDLVFDAQYFKHMDMFAKMNAFEKMQYAGGVGAEIVADPYASACTTTTEFLAEKLRERGKRVFLVPNRLSQEDVFLATQISRLKTYRLKKSSSGASSSKFQVPSSDSLSPVTIGYFSGTKSHDKDFAVAAPALKRILEKYPHVRLFLVGPLEQGSIFEPFRERIETLPYVPRKEHFKNIARVDINIAPLEMGNPFCESKSELKFFEAGVVEVPTVASATRTFKEAISDGVDGCVASSEEEWFEKTSRLVENDELRRNMGHLAHRTATKRYTTKVASNEEYYSFLRQCIQRSKET